MVNNLKRVATNFKVRWSGASGFYFFTLGLNVQELELQSRGEGVEKRGDGGECFLTLWILLSWRLDAHFHFVFVQLSVGSRQRKKSPSIFGLSATVSKFSNLNWNYNVYKGHFLVRQLADQVICTMSLIKKCEKNQI